MVFTHCSRSMKYSIALVALFSAFIAHGTGQWVAGEPGSTCHATCTALDANAICDSDMQSSITSVALIESAFAEAGYTCLSATAANHRDYAGAPFHTGRDGDDCYFLSPGGISACYGNENDNHVPLCYCQIDASITASASQTYFILSPSEVDAFCEERSVPSMPTIYDSGSVVELIPVVGADPLFYMDITDNMEFSMDITINSFPASIWAMIFHCGVPWIPGIYIKPSGEFVIAFSTTDGTIWEETTPQMTTGTNYKLVIQVTQTSLHVTVNGDIIIDEPMLAEHALTQNSACRIGDPGGSFAVGDVVIKNLLITGENTQSASALSAHSVSGFAAVDTDAISTANKDLLIYVLVVLNVVTIVGCVCCLFWMNKRMVATKGYQGVVYSEEDVKINS